MTPQKIRRFEGPLMALIFAACSAGLVYVAKDYYDGQERNLLYSRIANARQDERKHATQETDVRITEVRTYYAALGKERDKRLQELTQQNERMLDLVSSIADLIKQGQSDRKKALGAAYIAVTKATQAAVVADNTNKTLNTVVNKDQVPETTVKKLNDKIKDVNRK